jgi:hypothetical protein
MCGFGIVFELESGNDEEDEVHHEANRLHPFATIELVVDQETCKVVAAQGAANVDHVVKPTRHYGGRVVGDDLDELALEELVAVEENVVHVPATRSCENATTEVLECKSERLGIVTCDTGLLLRNLKLLAGRSHFEGTEIDQP